MTTTSKRLIDLRIPYIKLIIVMGLITLAKDYQKTDNTNYKVILKLKKAVKFCFENDASDKKSNGVPCSPTITTHFNKIPTHEI
jgi:hypothetical protein